MAARKTTMDRLQELVRLHRLGTGTRESARLLKMSPNTERRYREALQAAGLYDGLPDGLPTLAELRQAVGEARSAVPLQQRSGIESWRPMIEKLMDAGLRPKAVRRRLLEQRPDFPGTYAQVKRLAATIRRERGVRAEDVAIPVQTDPGQVVQLDFGYIGKLVDPTTYTLRKAWVFVAVLGYSRVMWAKIVFDQKVTTWIQLHVELFEALGGVPQVMVPDNLKAAVIRAAFTPNEQTSLNRSYRELARHYGFKVDPTPPYSPQKKGKVESGVKYLKTSVLQGRDGEDAHEVQAQLEHFLEHEANVRVHGTTRRVPRELLEHERVAFRPLPGVRYEPILWREAKVHTDCHVQFDKRLFSVPWRLVGQQVWLRVTPTTLYAYADDARVATHSLGFRGARSTCEEHLPEHRRDLRHRSREHWENRADHMGLEVGALVREIFDSDDVLYQLRTVQAVVTYLEDFPPHRATAAAKRARFYGVSTYGGIKKILVKGLDLRPLPTAVLPINGQLDAPRFARDIAQLSLLSGPMGGEYEPQ
jgi:transposase